MSKSFEANARRNRWADFRMRNASAIFITGAIAGGLAY
jgi:hypothetical protein